MGLTIPTVAARRRGVTTITAERVLAVAVAGVGVPTESTTPRPDWDLVRLAEVAPAAFAGRVADEVERAEQAYTSVGKERVDKKIRAVQEGPYNRARLVRFSDYLAPGGDVFEIGCGRSSPSCAPAAPPRSA